MPKPRMPKKLKKPQAGFRNTATSVLWVLKLFWSISPRLTFITIAAEALLSLESILNTYIFAKGIDILIEVSQGNRDIVWVYYFVGIFFILALLQSGLRLVLNYSRNMMNMHFYPKFQQLMYQKLIRMGIENLEDPETNNLIERARRNTNRIYNQFAEIRNFIGNTTTIFSSGAILIIFAPHLVPLFVLTLIPSLIVDRKYLSKLWRYSRQLTEERRGAYASASYLQNSRTLHELTITGGFNLLSNHFEDFVNKWLRGNRKIRRTWYKYLFSFRIIRAAVEGYADLFIILRFVRNQITIGDVTFYIRQASSFMGSLSNSANLLNNIYEGSLYVNETKELFDKPEREDGTISLERLSVGPDISFDNISFKYPRSKKSVISNLDLKIKSGEKLAIVGHNGAGKTTLVKLLMQFYRINEGKIAINGIDIDDLKVDDYYKNVSVLFQEYNTYRNLTVRENISIGKIQSKFSEKEMKKAAKFADVDDFVNEFDKGYNQVLSEKYKGGIRPSTGQWQKIAIARFFYRNAPLVIFDEPTAAIDAVSEQKIFNKIYKFFKKKTVIIISHRFSTVRNADRIIVFDKGKIIEQGTHEELIKLDGSYAKSFNLQAKGYQ